MSLEPKEGYFIGRFQAMASPCEFLVETEDPRQAHDLLRTAAREAWRIEAKFSRYRRDSAVARVNSSGGARTKVDAETARLLDFAHLCHQLSGGLFDVTSGVLRRVWKFDGSGALPAQEEVASLLPLVGWGKVSWKNPYLLLPNGMELDFGGLGKEYAADRALLLAQEEARIPMAVNFGGDMAVSGPRSGGEPWIVGVEDPEGGAEAFRVLKVSGGGLATSGDSRRFLMKEGKRYGHILDPRTGWPVEGAVRSVSVAEGSCVRAGMLATMAILRGPRAGEFLTSLGVAHWIAENRPEPYCE